jgi:hypothetical protein
MEPAVVCVGGPQPRRRSVCAVLALVSNEVDEVDGDGVTGGAVDVVVDNAALEHMHLAHAFVGERAARLLRSVLSNSEDAALASARIGETLHLVRRPR